MSARMTGESARAAVAAAAEEEKEEQGDEEVVDDTATSLATRARAEGELITTLSLKEVETAALLPWLPSRLPLAVLVLRACRRS